MPIINYAFNALYELYHQVDAQELAKFKEDKATAEMTLEEIAKLRLAEYMFGGPCVEVKAIQRDFARRQQLSRYVDYPGIKHPTFETYNMNPLAEFPHIVIGEGPANAAAYRRLIANTVHNGKLQKPVSFLAIGQHQERDRSKYHLYAFYNYSKNSRIGAAQVEEDGVEFQCFQIEAWPDFGTLDLTDKEAASLYKWLDDDSHICFIHCSAGLGRSGTLVLAYVLAKKLGLALETMSEEEAGKAVAQALYSLRQIRPGLVQTVEQLQMAIILAKQFAKVAQLILTNDPSIRDSVDFSELATSTDQIVFSDEEGVAGSYQASVLGTRDSVDYSLVSFDDLDLSTEGRPGSDVAAFTSTSTAAAPPILTTFSSDQGLTSALTTAAFPAAVTKTKKHYSNPLIGMYHTLSLLDYTFNKECFDEFKSILHTLRYNPDSQLNLQPTMAFGSGGENYHSYRNDFIAALKSPGKSAFLFFAGFSMAMKQEADVQDVARIELRKRLGIPALLYTFTNAGDLYEFIQLTPSDEVIAWFESDSAKATAWQALTKADILAMGEKGKRLLPAALLCRHFQQNIAPVGFANVGRAIDFLHVFTPAVVEEDVEINKNILLETIVNYLQIKSGETGELNIAHYTARIADFATLLNSLAQVIARPNWEPAALKSVIDAHCQIPDPAKSAKSKDRYGTLRHQLQNLSPDLLARRVPEFIQTYTHATAAEGSLRKVLDDLARQGAFPARSSCSNTSQTNDW